MVEFEPRQPRRRRPKAPPPECAAEDEPRTPPTAHASSRPHAAQPQRPVVSGGLWTDDDLVELIRLIKKYPPGTGARWEKIAEAMARTVAEVTHMAKKVRRFASHACY